MQKLKTILFALLFGTTLQAQNGDFYTIDTQHSTIDFKTRHIGFSAVRGNFGSYEGVIYFDPSDITKTSASLTIESESIDTGAGGRDGVLKKYFFEVDKYPYLTFTSTGVEKRDQLYLKGDLTLGGVTKPVEIPFELLSGPAQDQWSHQRITLAGELTLNRRDYELYYRDNEFWDNVVADKVTIEIEVGARVYNSLETIFPFRENAISRLAFEAYQKGGKSAMLSTLKDVLETEQTDPSKFITSNGQILRGGTHLLQAIGAEAAADFAEYMVYQQIQPLSDEMKSEMYARWSQYLLILGQRNLAREKIDKSFEFYQNTLAREVLKQIDK